MKENQNKRNRKVVEKKERKENIEETIQSRRKILKGKKGERDNNKRIREYAIVKSTIRKGGQRKLTKIHFEGKLLQSEDSI